MRPAWVVLTAVVLSVVACAVLFNGRLSATMPDSAAGESTYARVMRTGKIRCGYLPIQAVTSKDARTGALSGPGYDIVNLAAQNLGLSVEWVGESTFAHMSEDLSQGRYDMICTPVMPSAARGKVLDFSRLLFMMPALVYVHADDPRASDDLSWMNDEKTVLSFIDGIVFETLARREFPKATVHHLPELSAPIDQLMDVGTKKADATVLLAYDGEYFMKANNNSVKPVSLRPIAQIFYGLPLPKGDEKFRTMIDTALNEMVYNGTVDRILDTHDPARQRYTHLKPIY